MTTNLTNAIESNPFAAAPVLDQPQRKKSHDKPTTTRKPRGKGKASAVIAAAPAWEFDPSRYGALGQEMAIAAKQQVQSAGTFWDRCRTLYVEAQEHGKAQEALDALFGPGEKVKGKKAPWFRTYKSILTNALTNGVTITNEMGMSAAQKSVKAAKDEATDNDEESSQAKTNSLLDMFTKLAQGCLNRGVPKSQLATILKGLEA